MKIIKLNSNFKNKQAKEAKDYRQYKRLFKTGTRIGLNNKLKHEHEELRKKYKHLMRNKA